MSRSEDGPPGQITTKVILQECGAFIPQLGSKRKFEIGRILHLKIEIRNFKLDCAPIKQSNLRFRISDLRCRIRPISKFPLASKYSRQNENRATSTPCLGNRF